MSVHGRTWYCVALVGWWLILGWTAWGQQSPQARAVFTESPPLIDGKTDDPVWKQAQAIDRFIQFEPTYGKSPAERTEVRLLYDTAYLYVAFDCFIDATHQILSGTTQRDSPFFSDDYVGIYLDTFFDRRNCYAFLTNALGTPRDMRIANEGLNQSNQRGGDASWDATWQVKSARLADRWSAEMAIPFSELRFDAKGDVWGVNFWRNIEATDEEATWADVGARTYNVSRYGTLTGLDISRLERGKLLSLLPYATMNPHKRTNEDFEFEPKAGLDIRYPFTGFTLDFTLNPDFAQIEADPTQVNLSDVELRLQEKRPFFLEGGEIYRTPVELFYTRRVEDLKFGAKMAGRVGSQNIALMTAQSSPLSDIYFNEEGIEEPNDEFNESANFTAFRYQRDVNAALGVGVIGVNKHVPALDRTNGAGGVDVTAKFPRDITLAGQFAQSWDRNRRPEAGKPFSPDWKTDHAAILNIQRRTNTWQQEFMYGNIGKEFHADAGFIPRTDRKGVRGEFGYRRQFERNFPSRIGSGIQYERLTDSAGVLTNERTGLEFNLGFKDIFFFGGPQRYYRVDDFGTVFMDETVELFSGWFPPKYGSIRIFQNIGFRDGRRKWFFSPSFFVRPTEKWQVEYSQQREVERDPILQEWKFINWVQRVQTHYQFTQTAFLSGSAEVNLLFDETRFFLLYGVEYRSRSFFYIVYNEQHLHELDGRPITDRAVFVKASYLTKPF